MGDHTEPPAGAIVLTLEVNSVYAVRSMTRALLKTGFCGVARVCSILQISSLVGSSRAHNFDTTPSHYRVLMLSRTRLALCHSKQIVPLRRPRFVFGRLRRWLRVCQKSVAGASSHSKRLLHQAESVCNPILQFPSHSPYLVDHNGHRRS